MSIPSKITPGSKVLIRCNVNKPGISSKLTHQFSGPYRCVRIESNHIFLTPIDKPNAVPFSWHIDHTKLAHTADATTAEYGSSTNGQTIKSRAKPKVQFPIDQPAEHRHYLRSKQCVEQQ